MEDLARWTLGLAVCMQIAGTAGCGPTAVDVAEQASTLKPLAVVYGRFIGEHRGQPPANEAEFKAFAQTKAQPLIEAQGLKDVESLFVSARDNKPYIILYGPLTGPPGLNGQPVFAYEQEGVGGKRLVANSLGEVKEVDAENFKTLVPTAN